MEKKRREERKKEVRENERRMRERERGESWVKEEALYHIVGEKISTDFEVL